MDLPGKLPRVCGEPRAFNQVFLNLLKNAAESFEGRGGTISVIGRVDSDTVVLEIRDDGPGIDPEVRVRVFEPFFTTRSEGGGTGLGLSICRRIVEEHGGRIELESQPSAGTVVRLHLPAGRTGEVASAP